MQNIPEAVRQILRNERITHEPDVKRIMSEIGVILQQRQRRDTAESEIWKEILEEEMVRGAKEAHDARGGDPDDEDFGLSSEEYRIGPKW